MSTAAQPSAQQRITTTALAPPRRLPALRDLFDRAIGMDLEATPEQSVELEVDAVPGLRRTLMLRPLTAHAARPPVRSDGDDTVCLMVQIAGRVAVRQGRREGSPMPGDGVLLVYRQPSQVQFHDATYLSIRVPFQALEMLVDVEAAAARCISRENAAFGLLRTYVASLPSHLDSPDMARLVATHVHDLMALAIGARPELDDPAPRRTVRAARRMSIQAELRRDPDLHIDEIARRQGVTPRYIQMLFEEQGTTFGEFITQHRLDLVCDMLRSPRYAAWSISGIAFEAGFRDLSHFNRHFKRRHGATPSDFRRRLHAAGQ